MFPVAIVAAHATHNVRRAQQHAAQRQVATVKAAHNALAKSAQERLAPGFHGAFDSDPTISPAMALFKRYWWFLPIAGIGILTSYQMRKKEGKGRQVGEVILDSVQILSALAGIVALLELEAAKQQTALPIAMNTAAGMHGSSNFEPFMGTSPVRWSDDTLPIMQQ